MSDVFAFNCPLLVPVVDRLLSCMGLPHFFSVTDRTIRSWRAAGAPLNQPAKLLRWLRNRRRSSPTVALRLSKRSTLKKLTRLLAGDPSELSKAERELIHMKRRTVEALEEVKKARSQRLKAKAKELHAKAELADAKRLERLEYTRRLYLQNTGICGTVVPVAEVEKRRLSLLGLFELKLRCLEMKVNLATKYGQPLAEVLESWLSQSFREIEALRK